MKKTFTTLFLFIVLFSIVNIFAQDNFSNKKNEYQVSYENYSKSRNEYLSLYNQYRSECLRDEKNCEKFKERVLEKAKNYFKSSISVAVFYLELIKIKIEDSQGDDEQKKELIQKMDSLITSFKNNEEVIEKINDSSSVKNLSASFKATWVDAEKQVAVVKANLYLWKVQQQNKKVNDFSLEIENYIIKLGQDKDISNLVSKYNEIKSSLLDLNSSVELLKKDTEDMNYEKYNIFKQKVVDYKNKELQVLANLRQIILDLKKNNFSTLPENESGILEIKGEGKIILNGNFEITGNLSDSGLTGEISASVSDEVDTYDTGQGLKTGDNILYKKVEKFKINSKKTIEINSGYLDVVIKGNGRVKVIGYGLYKSGINGSWLEIEKDNFEVSI